VNVEDPAGPGFGDADLHRTHVAPGRGITLPIGKPQVITARLHVGRDLESGFPGRGRCGLDALWRAFFRCQGEHGPSRWPPHVASENADPAIRRGAESLITLSPINGWLIEEPGCHALLIGDPNPVNTVANIFRQLKFKGLIRSLQGLDCHAGFFGRSRPGSDVVGEAIDLNGGVPAESVADEQCRFARTDGIAGPEDLWRRDRWRYHQQQQRRTEPFEREIREAGLIHAIFLPLCG